MTKLKTLLCVILFGGGTLGIVACQNISKTPTKTAAKLESASNWIYDSDESGMTFITIHNGDVAEINTFRQISGTVSSQGAAVLSIDLNSVDSADENRDSLYRTALFETMKFPTLTVQAKIDMNNYAELEIGERYTELLDMTIDLHGIKKSMQYYVMVTRLADDRVLIENKAPLLLSASDFGMSDGIAQLRRVPGVRSITPVTTATLSFVFVRSQ